MRATDEQIQRIRAALDAVREANEWARSMRREWSEGPRRKRYHVAHVRAARMYAARRARDAQRALVALYVEVYGTREGRL